MVRLSSHFSIIFFKFDSLFNCKYHISLTLYLFLILQLVCTGINKYKWNNDHFITKTLFTSDYLQLISKIEMKINWYQSIVNLQWFTLVSHIPSYFKWQQHHLVFQLPFLTTVTSERFAASDWLMTGDVEPDFLVTARALLRKLSASKGFFPLHVQRQQQSALCSFRYFYPFLLEGSGPVIKYCIRWFN